MLLSQSKIRLNLDRNAEVAIAAPELQSEGRTTVSVIPSSGTLCACCRVVGDTLSMVARGVRDPGSVFQYKLLYECRGGRLHHRLASGVGAAGGGGVRPAGRVAGRAGRAGPGEEPAVGGGEAR